MAEKKSRFQRAVEYLNRPPERYNNLQEQIDNLSIKRDINLDPDRVSLYGPVYGYNTKSGYFPDANEVGDGTGNSAVVACLEVLSTSFSEAQLEVYELDKDTNQYEIIHNHPMSNLFKKPNPYMSGELLNSYMMYSLHAQGNAYLFKRRSEKGRVVELHPIMPHMIYPKGNQKDLITHYDYELPDGKVKIEVDDIIHLRLNMDTHDHRVGRAPLKNVLREIIGDESAGQFATSLLKNMGVPGVILSPKGGDDIFGGPTKEQAEQIAEAYKNKFGGANRGAPMVLSGPMDVDVVAFSPDQLNLNELRRIPEERVSAVLGVPAILAGLGAGLDAATYSNARELREFFTENKLVPLWRIIAGELTHQLLRKDFTDNLDVVARFNVDNVKAMAEDRAELLKSMDIGVKGGWVSIAEARQALGLPTNDSHNVYLRSLQWMETAGDTDGLGTVYTGDPIIDDEPKPFNEQVESESDQNLMEGTAIGKSKELLSTDTFPVDSERQNIILTPTRLDESKYVAEMPNGAFCILRHQDNEVIKCYQTRKEAEDALERMKKEEEKADDVYGTEAEAETRARELGCEGSHERNMDGNIMYMPCSTRQEYEKLTQDKPEVMPKPIEYTEDIKIDGTQLIKDALSEFELELDILEMEAKAPGDPATRNADGPKLDSDDITNFPEKGENMAISLRNSRYKVFPDYAFVLKMKEDYPSLWRRAGTGGNPPTAFTGNDAFRNWSKYRKGDRSTAVLAWVRRRELYMGRHAGDKLLNGTIAMMKWGGITKAGPTEMKKIVREAMKKIDDKKEAKQPVTVPESVKKILADKVKKHNAKSKYKVTSRMLQAVYRRGIGAYFNNPSSVRGNVSSARQWALARVNAFLAGVRGKFPRKPFDTDLLPAGHPMKKSMKAESVKVGDYVSWSINKDPDPPSVIHGIVDRIVKTGTVKVGNEKYEASADKPVAVMTVYAQIDGRHEKTNRKVARYFSALRIIQPWDK